MINRKICITLGFIFMILMMLFIYQDMSHEATSCSQGYPSIEKIGEPLDFTDVYCIVNAEIYEPFIWLFSALWIICWVWGGALWIIDQVKR